MPGSEHRARGRNIPNELKVASVVEVVVEEGLGGLDSGTGKCGKVSILAYKVHTFLHCFT